MSENNQDLRSITLGGWISPEFAPERSVVLGYCIEKITGGFQVLKRMTRMEEHVVRTTRKHRISDIHAGEGKREREQKEKARIMFQEAIRIFEKEGDIMPLVQIGDDDDMLDSLPLKEKGLMLMVFVKRRGKGKSHYQNVALNLLHSAKEAGEFRQLLDMAGGRDAVEKYFEGVCLGRFLYLLEKYGIDLWCAPFEKELFASRTGRQESEEGWAEQLQSSGHPLVHPEYMTAFLKGEVTASAMLGLRTQELYRIAERGYRMIDQGKLENACEVFDALVYLDPFNAYFSTVLGGIRQKQKDEKGALACFQRAINMQSDNVSALANRGEIYFGQGNS